MLITGGKDLSIRVWDVNSGECLQVLEGHTHLVRSVAYDPLRKRVLSGSYDKT